MSTYDYLFRILIVGDAIVGKTSICNRITSNVFSLSCSSTIGVDFSTFNIKLPSEHVVKCQLWDTAGCERFRSITHSYYHDAALVMLVFDLSDKDSFYSLDMWLKEIRLNVNNDTYKILLVGNKSDMKPDISRDEILDFITTNNIKYIETSAKYDTDIRFKFSNYICELMDEKDFARNSSGVRKSLSLDNTKKYRDDEFYECCCSIQ